MTDPQPLTTGTPLAPSGGMPPHRWTFMRAGGVDQVVIRSGADVVHLEALDQKLWVALACPTHGLHFDAATLDLLDTDGDGRIRAPEVIEASRWVRTHFANPDELLEATDTVALSSIPPTDEGKALADEARDMLRRLGRENAEAFTLADVIERAKTFNALPFNGDGIVPAESTDDPGLKQLIADIIATHGSVEDASGRPGIDRAKADAFFAEVDAVNAWLAKGEADRETTPLGDKTLEASEAALAVRDKVDDFFVRTRVAAYDASSGAELNPRADDYREMAHETLSVASAHVAELPLALVAPGRALPLREGINPAWQDKIDALRERALEPLFGRELHELTEADWREAQRRLVPCEKWLRAKPETRIDALGIERVRALGSSDAKQKLEALIARDEAAKGEFARLHDLEKMARFKRDLVHFLNNFVSFSEFYARQTAIFEAGILYLDARSCDLTIEVEDAAKHAALAGLAKAYLAYCECRRGKEKKTIVTAFTAGDVDYLLVGRNGVFYDREGRDWDATITKVVENPISMRQAFFSPYKKFVRMIEEQVAKRAASADKNAQGKLSALATNVVKPQPAGTAPAAPAAPAARVDVGTVAALGVALGSISTVIVGVFSKFIDLGFWIPVALVGIVLAISGPSVIIAWLKLRQRSLGPILDASGWAINGHMRINVPLGASLSKTPKLPPCTIRTARDPYARSHAGFYVTVIVAIAAAAYAAWRMGWLGPLLP
jgi:hypothetical protein